VPRGIPWARRGGSRSRPAGPRAVGAVLAVLLLASATPVAAQLAGSAGAPTFDTTREDEFRSRWADYQVDRPPDPNAPATSDNNQDQAGLLAAFGRSFSDHFRTGPLQLRADLSAGYEYTNETALRVENPHGTDESPFLAPALGAFYNQELGPLTVSARYSLGYVYYLQQSYLAADHSGGIFSQTAALDLSLDGKRAQFTSSSSASQGTGEEVESGELRDRLTVAELLNGVYTVTDYTQIGASGGLNYASYSGGTSALNSTAYADSSSTTTVSGQLFGDYIVTGKTRLRIEFGAGDEDQTVSGASDSNLSYYQALLSVNYLPAPKLTLDGGLGWGLQYNSAAIGKQDMSSHPVYSVTISYAPTVKTAASLHVGYEGVDVAPDFSLLAHYQARQNTALELSAYQSSNYSTFLASENLVTRGVLASVQQRFFDKVEVALGSGAEQDEEYLNDSEHGGFTAPYYFASISILWQFNPSFALQSYYRGYTGQAGQAYASHGLQSTASVSLRLTF
jgi:hypothetical protein